MAGIVFIVNRIVTIFSFSPQKPSLEEDSGLKSEGKERAPKAAEKEKKTAEK